MQINVNDHWIEIMPSMLSCCRRNGKNEEFEQLIIQHPNSAAEYAGSVIRGRWEEAEDIICTDAASANNYARNVIRGRWEKGEDIIATDANNSYHYARHVLKGRFQKGEESIAKDANLSFQYARDVLKSRFIEGEPAIASLEAGGSNPNIVKNYYSMFIKSPSDWSTWTEDQLKHSPCWMYMYAKEYLKGRLPDFLHNTMNVFAMTIPDNYYVKRYFKAKKYNKKIKRRKKSVNILENKESNI